MGWLRMLALSLLLPSLTFASQNLAVLTDVNTSGETNTTTTFEKINTGSGVLPLNGIDYLVFYHASFGQDGANAVGEAQIRLGSTVIGISTGEGSGDNTATGTQQLMGVRKITGNGTDRIVLEHRNLGSGDTVQSDDTYMVAIPLNDPNTIIAENQDYFFSGTNSATAEQTNVGNSFVDVRSVTFTMPSPTQNYDLFYSVEAEPGSGCGATDGVEVKFLLDGNTVGPGTFVKECEDSADHFNAMWSDFSSIASGDHTLKIQVRNRNTSSIVNAFRSNIAALRTGRFLAGNVFSTSDTTGQSGTNTSLDTSHHLMSLSVPFTATAQMFAFGATVMTHSSSNQRGLAEICTGTYPGPSNCTGSTYQTGENMNDGGNDSGDDFWPTWMLYSATSGQLVGKNVRTRAMGSAAGTWCMGKNLGCSAGSRSTLMILPMAIEVPEDPISEAGMVIMTR